MAGRCRAPVGASGVPCYARTMEGGSDLPERRLVLLYAPPGSRAGLAALLELDDALASLLRTTREPAIAQIRLAWWRERLSELGVKPPPAMPVLQAVAEHVVGQAGITGAMLVPIVEGWEVLIEAEALDRAALQQYAAGRGEALFALVARLAGRETPQSAGEGWALADLSRHLDRPEDAALAAEMATIRLAPRRRWPRALRGLGAMTILAGMDLDTPSGESIPTGSPRRVARLLWMRLFGR